MLKDEILDCLWCGEVFPRHSHNHRFHSFKCAAKYNSVLNRLKEGIYIEAFKLSRDEQIAIKRIKATFNTLENQKTRKEQ